MSKELQKEKLGINHAEVGKNLFARGRLLLFHEIFFQVKINIIHFTNQYNGIPFQGKKIKEVKAV